MKNKSIALVAAKVSKLQKQQLKSLTGGTTEIIGIGDVVMGVIGIDDLIIT